MKTLNQLRTFLAAALILATAASCTKDNNISSNDTSVFENARKRSNSSQGNISAYDNSLTMIENNVDAERLIIQTAATATHPAMRIAITQNEMAYIFTDNESKAFRIATEDYNRISDLIATFDPNNVPDRMIDAGPLSFNPHASTHGRNLGNGDLNTNPNTVNPHTSTHGRNIGNGDQNTNPNVVNPHTSTHGRNRGYGDQNSNPNTINPHNSTQGRQRGYSDQNANPNAFNQHTSQQEYTPSSNAHTMNQQTNIQSRTRGYNNQSDPTVVNPHTSQQEYSPNTGNTYVINPDNSALDFRPNNSSFTMSDVTIAMRRCVSCEQVIFNVRSDVMRIRNSQDLVKQVSQIFDYKKIKRTQTQESTNAVSRLRR
ncbi:MAG: hypothetical protein DWQ39_05010 [Bacteroidetes bacterium]|nr:MAG: hypothetical protein DWQ39_05010 [Bacteroidota bacterium]